MADFMGLLSGGLLSNDAPNYAKLAAQNENKRKGLINLGLSQINSVFDGGTAPFFRSPSDTSFGQKEWRQGGKDQQFYFLNRQGKFAPYYAPRQKGSGPSAAEQGNLWGGGVGGVLAGLGSGDVQGATRSAMFGLPGQMSLMSGLFGDDDPMTPRELVNRQLRRGNLFTAPESMTFEGYKDPFFQKRAQDYVNFAMPQLAQQYMQNRDAITYGLANRGLQGSTVSDKASSNLEREATRGRQSIADEGVNQSNALRQTVENARQQAIQQLYQSADPAQAIQGALRAAQGFSAPSTFAPLSNMFGNLAQQYYTSQLLNSYRQPIGAPGRDNLSSYLAPI